MRHPLQRHRCINLFVYSYDRSCAFLQVQFVPASPSRTNVHGPFRHSFAIASFGSSFYTKFRGNFCIFIFCDYVRELSLYKSCESLEPGFFSITIPPNSRQKNYIIIDIALQSHIPMAKYYFQSEWRPPDTLQFKSTLIAILK